MAWRSKEYTGDEKPFNFAQLLLERLNELFKVANEARYSGEVIKWLDCLDSIHSSISFKYGEIELKEIEEIFTQLNNRIQTAKDIDNPIFFKDIKKQLRVLEMKLVKFMYDFGLFYPKYESKSWEQVVMEEDV